MAPNQLRRIMNRLVDAGPARQARHLDELRREVRDLHAMVQNVAAQSAANHLRTEQLVTLERENVKSVGRLARAEDLLDMERVGTHAREAIRRSEVHRDPFPHAVISNLLPMKTYKTVVDAIPPRVFFEDRPVNKQQLTVPPEFAPQFSIAVWEFVTEVVKQAIAPALAERFREPIDEHVRTLCPSIVSSEEAGITMTSSDGRIMLRRPGYVIPPHRDPHWGFLTTIMYLARPQDREEYGTQLYRLQEEREAPGNAPLYVDPAQCQLVKTVPFRPNTALIFLNSVGAHGASIPREAPADTERYIYQFRVGPEKDASVTFLEKMDEATRRRWAGAGPVRY